MASVDYRETSLLRAPGRALPVLLAAMLALLVGGCLQSETIIRVKADGSGEIEVLAAMSEDAAREAEELARAMAPEGTETAESSESELFPTEEMESKASDFGEGVRFVRREAYKANGLVGARAFYAFDDIRKIHVSNDPAADSGMEGGDEGSGSAGGSGEDILTFDLEALDGGRSLLRIHVPQEEMDLAGEDEEPDPASEEDAEMPSEEDLEMLSELFGGFRFAVIVEPVGSIVRTTSPHRDGDRVTLFDIDFGKLIADVPKFREIAGRGQPSSMTEAAAWLQEVEGIKVHLDPMVEIEFEGKR